MSYRIVGKERLVIHSEMSIPIPMSHVIEIKSAALRWMSERGMQKECEVISESLFRALSGLCPAQEEKQNDERNNT